MIGRRGLLKGGLAGALVSGCGTYYVGEGDKVAVPTDGQLLPTTVAYFNQGGIGSRFPVKAYDPELADIVNEVWVREFSSRIDRHVYIQFVDDIPGDNNGQYDTSSRFDWHRLKDKKERQITVVAHAEPFYCFAIINHELGHQWGTDESIAWLMAYRNATMSCVHFPQFGRDTGYGNFTIIHSDMLRLTDFNSYASWDNHNIGALAALLALNEHNGSFRDAHSALVYSSDYWYKAHDFMGRYCDAAGAVAAKAVSPFGLPESDVTISENIMASRNLWNIVGLQVLKHNVLDNPDIDAATKSWLYPEIKLAARFQQTSNVGNSSGVMPSINPPQMNFYSGAIVPQDRIIVPAGYNNDIPRGL